MLALANGWRTVLVPARGYKGLYGGDVRTIRRSLDESAPSSDYMDQATPSPPPCAENAVRSDAVGAAAEAGIRRDFSGVESYSDARKRGSRRAKSGCNPTEVARAPLYEASRPPHRH